MAMDPLLDNMGMTTMVTGGKGKKLVLKSFLSSKDQKMIRAKDFLKRATPLIFLTEPICQKVLKMVKKALDSDHSKNIGAKTLGATIIFIACQKEGA